MNEQMLFDNAGHCVQKVHAERVICSLRDLTPEKTQNAVSIGFFGKPDGARISLMKSGKMRITRDCLESFAKHYDFSIDHLIEKIIHVKTETTTIPTPISNDEKFSDVIIDKSNRERFLCALQGLLEIRDGVMFRAALNKEDPSYYLQFYATGKVPQAWLDLIPDHDVKKRLCTDFTEPKHVKDAPAVTPPTRSHIQKMISKCTQLSDVPKEFLDAFFPACYAAGKARHLDCALQVFVGTLVTQLPRCTVASETLDDLGRKVVIIIHNGKTAMEFCFDPVSMFS